MHFCLSAFDEPGTFEGIAYNFQRLGQLGLEVHITELEFNCSPYGDPCPRWNRASLDKQAALYRQVTRLCLDYSHICTMMSTWGASDRFSWRGPEQHALLFDEEFRPKPAFFALAEEFARPPSSPLQFQPNPSAFNYTAPHDDMHWDGEPADADNDSNRTDTDKRPPTHLPEGWEGIPLPGENETTTATTTSSGWRRAGFGSVGGLMLVLSCLVVVLSGSGDNGF